MIECYFSVHNIRLHKRDADDADPGNNREENTGFFQQVWNYIKKQLINVVISTVVGWIFG